MARERYLVNAGEETINKGEIKLETKKEQRANFWYYNRWKILISALCVVLVFSFVYSMVTRVKPDYQIALMTQIAYPQDVYEQMADQMEQYAEDLNGDGKVVIQINNYQYIQGAATEKADANTVMAGVVKFSADAQTGESMIYITDETSYQNVAESGTGYFVYLDDWTTPPENGAEDLDRTKVAWKDCKGVASFDVDYDIENISHEDLQAMLFDDLSFSLRSIKYGEFENDGKKVAYYEASKKLLERIIAGS